MKKILIGTSSFLVLFTVFACLVLNTPNRILYFLNWGEYIDSSLVRAFEAKYNCQVIEEDVTSSEAMYQKIAGGTTSYDVAIPGDYVVTRLNNEGLLRRLDVNNSSLPNLFSYQSIFTDDLKKMMDAYMVDQTTGESIESYFMPYFWGAYSLIYATRKDGVEEGVLEKGFASLYDSSALPSGAKKGMYDTARWIVASYLLAQGMDPNLVDKDGHHDGDISDELKKEIISAVKQAQFSEIANDALKRDVVNGRLDMCFTQLGDYFDGLYFLLEANGDRGQYKLSVPKTTAAFFDGMVIPTTCQNYELANAFIDFMLDPDNSYQNARAIGYSPCLKSVVTRFEEGAKNGEEYYEGFPMSEFLASYPNYLNPLYDVEKCYMFEAKSNEYLTTCETILNNLSLN